MKRSCIGVVSATAVLMVVWPLLAAPPNRAPAKGKSNTKNPEVKQLYGLDWHTRVDTALKKAAGGEKPVMVLRVLGELDGFM